MLRTVAPNDARQLIAEGDIDVVDDREPHEWATGHLSGARVVPLGRLRADLAAAKLGKRVLFVCEKGGRSQQAGELADKNAHAGRHERSRAPSTCRSRRRSRSATSSPKVTRWPSPPTFATRT